MELISRLVETCYAGAAEGVSLDAAKVDAIQAVFGGGSPWPSEAVRGNTPVGHSFRGNQYTVGDLMFGLPRTPAIKSLHQDINDNAYHTMRMTPGDAINHLDETIKTWSDSLEEVRKIKDGAADISGRHLQDLRFREGQSGKSINPNEWAEKIGMPTHENQIASYKRAKVAIQKLMQRHAAKRKAAEQEAIDSTDLTLRDALVHATDAELAELEAKLVAAEGAAHLNGEAAALEEHVAAVESRIRF